MKNFKTKICVICGEEFIPNSSTQKYCSRCRPIAYKEHIRQNQKQYVLNHPERIEQSRKQFQLNHPEYVREYQKRYREEHPESNRKWEREHPEQVRETHKRVNFRREHNLGFIPLNRYFYDSVAHHLDKTYVIYIPEEIHKSIQHSVLRNINMDEINAIAFNYIGVI